MRTTLWRYHLGGGLALALAYVYLPVPALRAAALAVLGLATIAATLAALRLWRPLRRLPFYLFAAGEAVGFVAGSMGSSVAVTGAGGNPAAAALTIVAYLIGIAGFALVVRARTPGSDRVGWIDATVIATGLGMLAWVFLMSPYASQVVLPVAERLLSMAYVALDVLLLALVVRLAISGGDRTRAFALITGGWLVLVAADSARALLLVTGTYDPASPVEAGWLVSYALWGAAVLEPSVATLTDPAPLARAGLTRARLAALAAASLMAPAVLALQAGRALPGGRRPGHHPGQHRRRLRRARQLRRRAAAAQRRHRHVRRQEPRQGHLRGVPAAHAAVGAGPPRHDRGPAGRDRPRRAGDPLPADRRPAHLAGGRHRGAGALAAAGPGAGLAGRVRPDRRGDRPGGRHRPLRAARVLPAGGGVEPAPGAPAAARQPLRHAPAARRRGQDRQVVRGRRHRRAGGVRGGPRHPGAGGDPAAGHRGRGVEHAGQASELARLGCRWAQGYHFSRPVAAPETARLAGRPASAVPGEPPVAALPHPA